MSKKRGYLLPSGDAFTDEQQCCFVYLPVGDEYRRAFFGALDYFGTWLAWETDDAKRGKDAAAAWKIANELTQECWEMGTCDLMVEKLEAIRLLLAAEPQCCGETDVTDGDFYTDAVTDGVGSVPQNIIDAGYASDANDWAGFDDYKCMVSHVIVDSLESKLRKMAPMVDNAGLVFGGVATLAAIVSVIFSGGLSALVIGILAATGATALLYTVITSGSLLEELADDIATDHNKLACAVYQGDGSSGSLAALNDKIDELFGEPQATILTNMNLGPELKALYGGRHDQQDIAAVLEAEGYELTSFDCEDCGDVELPAGEHIPNWHWRASGAEWTIQSDWYWLNAEGTVDGFEIDGTLVWDSSTYPSYQGDLYSDPFDWPGGVLNWTILARTSGSAVPERQRTSVIIRLIRVSDSQEMGLYSTIHEGDGMWTQEEDNGPNNDMDAGEYYIKVNINGYEGYGGKQIDFISLVVGP